MSGPTCSTGPTGPTGSTGPTGMNGPTGSTELATLIADLVQKKPQTKTDALLLLDLLEVKLAQWVVSELPVAEQKAVLALRWAQKEVETVTCNKC